MQFLELSLPARDVAESLAWYLALGFTEHETRDVREHHYAVVSDGRFCIGLHGDAAAAGLTFVRPDVARYVRQRETEGDQFTYTRLGEDQFNEAALADPDGTLFGVIEARTFSSAGTDPDSVPLTGNVEKITLPCVRVGESVEFWQRNGFIVVESERSCTAELHAPGLAVELSEGTRRLTLLFEPEDMHGRLRAFEASGLGISEVAEGHELIAPEGTRLLVRERQ